MNITHTNYNPKHNNKREIITWASGDGHIAKRLDYIMISNTRKYWINNVKRKRIANINRYYRRKIPPNGYNNETQEN